MPIDSHISHHGASASDASSFFNRSIVSAFIGGLLLDSLALGKTEGGEEHARHKPPIVHIDQLQDGQPPQHLPKVRQRHASSHAPQPNPQDEATTGTELREEL